jgi:hypothetical protein
MCVCYVCVSAMEIQIIGTISMKFETVEDQEPGMVFLYRILLSIVHTFLH